MKVCVSVAVVLFALGSFAGEQWVTAAVEPSENPVVNMSAKDYTNRLNAVRSDHVDVLLMGDSIMQMWANKGLGSDPNGRMFMERPFPDVKFFDFAVCGYHTGHVLRQIQDIDWTGCKPRVILLNIGHNNFYLKGERWQDTAEGVRRILKQLRLKAPQAKIVVHAIPPCGWCTTDNAQYSEYMHVNAEVMKLVDNRNIFWLDLSYRLSTERGACSVNNRLDGSRVHFAKPGYEAWAEALEPVLKDLLKMK